MDFSILNKEQIEAVKYNDGPLLIIAGAGTGKTRVLTYKIAYLIEKGVNPYQILGITFTNKAADEMKNRVDSLIENKNKVLVTTFHKFCGRVLRKYIQYTEYENNFTIYDTDEQKKFIKEILKELDKEKEKIKESTIASYISYCKNHNITAEEKMEEAKKMHDKNEKIKSECFKIYCEKMQKLNIMDFDDMLINCVKLLKNNEKVKFELQNQFKYILVDEYQDTNIIQFDLINLMCSDDTKLTVVGDDDQSIYKFRGADIKNILNFEKSFKNSKLIKLTQNYRSTNNILKVANCINKNNIDRKGKNLWSENGDGIKVKLYEYDTDQSEAFFTVENIKKIGDYKNTAILYRTNFQSRVLEEQCVKQGVPYILIGDVSFYQRKEIKDILSYLSFAANKNNIVAFDRIINEPKRGIGEITKNKIIKYASDKNIDILLALKNADEIGIKGKTKESILEFVNVIEKIEKANEIKDMIDIIRFEAKYDENLILEFGKDEGKERIENIDELNRVADVFKDTFINSNQDVIEDVSDINLLQEFLYDISLIATTDNINAVSDKITLMTLHASKGLEYDNVYIVGLNENLFPSQRSIEEGDIEEERRLFYVGITRAKNNLSLSFSKSRWGNGQIIFSEKSRFIDEIDEELLDKKEFNNNIYNDSFFYQNSYKKNVVSKKEFNYNKIKVSNFDNIYITGKELKKEDKLSYEVGDRVSHIKFGEGTVLKIEEMERDYEIVIKFDDYDEPKTMFAAYAKLVKV